MCLLLQKQDLKTLLEIILEIRKSTASEKTDIKYLHKKAFGEKEGSDVAKLAFDLLDDQSAFPLLSLVAVENDKIIGHVLFTKATLTGSDTTVNIHLLAPLGVLPEIQNKGIGQLLMKEGLKQLKEMGVELVFVLGHPDYYPKAGFTPAGALGFEAPYPIPEKDAGAWMVQELCEGVIGSVKGKVKCSDILDRPEHWQE